MGGGIGLVLGLIVMVFVHRATAQTVRVVGDSTGWTLPRTGNAAAFYSDWASKFNFSVGEYLTFNFRTNMHSVLKVPKEAFDACDPHNTTEYPNFVGPVTVKLDTVGMHYFFCTLHCLEGQKLSINVSVIVSDNTPSNAMSPSSNTPLPPPRTPSSHDESCTPTPANSSSSSPPICDGSSSAFMPSYSTLLMPTFMLLCMPFL